MQYTDHDYGDTAAEFAELRELLIESYAIAGRPGNWLHSRLEDWKYGGNSQRPARFFLENARVWRDQAGRLAGACICEYGGDGVYLQVHREHQSVEAAMLDWAVTIWGAGRPRVETYAYEHDEKRQRRLRERGFENAGCNQFMRRYDLARAYPAPLLPAGFRIGSLAEERDYDSYVAAVRSAFGRAVLTRAWFDSMITAPSYALEWNLVVCAPDGQHVAFCLAWPDERNQIAEIDPVGTRADYQQRGLAKALVFECFRRLQARGIRQAYIASGTEPAVGNRLYESLGPTEKLREDSWVKRLG